jgi:hypothetical protein
MAVQPVDITGGESTYCINQAQLKEAFRLAENDATSAPRIRAAIAAIQRDLNRNEQAALAFVLIDGLLVSSPAAPGPIVDAAAAS